MTEILLGLVIMPPKEIQTNPCLWAPVLSSQIVLTGGGQKKVKSENGDFYI